MDYRRQDDLFSELETLHDGPWDSISNYLSTLASTKSHSVLATSTRNYTNALFRARELPECGGDRLLNDFQSRTIVRCCNCSRLICSVAFETHRLRCPKGVTGTEPMENPSCETNIGKPQCESSSSKKVAAEASRSAIRISSPFGKRLSDEDCKRSSSALSFSRKLRSPATPRPGSNYTTRRIRRQAATRDFVLSECPVPSHVRPQLVATQRRVLSSRESIVTPTSAASTVANAIARAANPPRPQANAVAMRSMSTLRPGYPAGQARAAAAAAMSPASVAANNRTAQKRHLAQQQKQQQQQRQKQQQHQRLLMQQQQQRQHQMQMLQQQQQHQQRQQQQQQHQLQQQQQQHLQHQQQHQQQQRRSMLPRAYSPFRSSGQSVQTVSQILSETSPSASMEPRLPERASNGGSGIDELAADDPIRLVQQKLSALAQMKDPASVLQRAATAAQLNS